MTVAEERCVGCDTPAPDWPAGWAYYDEGRRCICPNCQRAGIQPLRYDGSGNG